jgi:hypothetical protein
MAQSALVKTSSSSAAFAPDANQTMASNDNMIAPEQEKSMAKQINATTTVLPSSHVAMSSHPKEVAKVIADAAAGAQRGYV